MKETNRQLQKEQTRNKIMEIALKEFAEGGLITTATSKIASAANVSHGTIFAHFKTKDILLQAVINEVGKRIISKLDELVNSSCNMKDVLFAHLIGISEYEDFYSRLILEGKLLNKELRNEIILIQSSISFHIGQIAEREMKEGKIKELPLDLLFNTWLGLIEHYLINKDLFVNKTTIYEEHGERIVNYFINLIKK